ESEKGRFLKGYEKELEWGNLEVANGNLSGAKIYYQRVALPGKNVFYIPILLYHGLSPQPRSPNLWVKRFADQNKALRQAGYTAITFKELNQILQGKAPLPAKPILITFDDARIDAFQIADPILKKYRMKATMFIPTGRILFKHPFFADWHMIRRYARSGRWNIQNHGHLAHDLIPIDAEGNEGNFLTSYKWLGQQGRKETSEEYILRLQEDHSSSTRVIQEEVPGSSVVAYAFPFSEAGQGGQGNVKNARRINERLLKKNFKFGLIQDLSGYNRLALGEKSPRFLKRFSVPREWSGGQLVQHLALKHPAHLATLATAKSQFWEGKFKKAQRTFKYLETKEPHFKPSIQSYFKKISYHSGHYRTAEKYLLAEQSQTATGKSDSPKLKQNILWKNRPQVISRFNYFGDSDDRTNLSISERFTFPLKIPMDLFVEGSYLNFEEDGFNDLRGYETVVGSTFWSSSLPLQFEGKIKHRSLDGIDDTQSYWASARYMMDNSRLHFRWSDQDVETLQALVAGIQVQDYQLVYQPRILSSLRGNFSLSYKDYDDGNSRFDARAQWRYKLPKLKRWEFGTDLSYLDTDFQTGLYYTPEELLLGMGKINFRESFGSRSVLNLQFGVGGAHDELSGTRSVINAGLRLEYYFTPRLKTELRGNYSQLPNYKSYNLQTQID
ncbi:MAG: polysaccharide deacetylase family protein, partial [Nitrospinales bacterium]